MSASIPHTFTLENLRNWKDFAPSFALPARLAVLGDPVAHSASPPMHNAALQACGIPCSYVRLHIRPGELSEAIHLAKAANFIGVNLTIPHKAAVLPLADQLDPSAQRLGVANTLFFANGLSTAFNTDGGGLVRAVLSEFGAHLGSLNALILGAGGGAGRAIAIQCVIEGCPSITLVNRTHSKAQDLAKELQTLTPNSRCPAPKIRAVPSNSPELKSAAARADILIQCSALGMQPGDPSPFPDELLKPSHLVYETIYSRTTQLLADAHSRKVRAANGLSMLLHQGALAFEIWFPQHNAPIDRMQAALLAAQNT